MVCTTGLSPHCLTRGIKASWLHASPLVIQSDGRNFSGRNVVGKWSIGRSLRAASWLSPVGRKDSTTGRRIVRWACWEAESPPPCKPTNTISDCCHWNIAYRTSTYSLTDVHRIAYLHYARYQRYDIVGFNVPLDTLGYRSFWRRFYGSDDPTNSVIAPKKDG